jgi:hypothetical protein
LDICRVNPSSIDRGDRGDWILLSGRDPSTYPGEIPNFFFININDGAYIATTTSYYRGNTKIKKRRAS